jgi:hypothetical protein
MKARKELYRRTALEYEAKAAADSESCMTWSTRSEVSLRDHSGGGPQHFHCDAGFEIFPMDIC